MVVSFPPTIVVTCTPMLEFSLPELFVQCFGLNPHTMRGMGGFSSVSFLLARTSSQCRGPRTHISITWAPKWPYRSSVRPKRIIQEYMDPLGQLARFPVAHPLHATLWSYHFSHSATVGCAAVGCARQSHRNLQRRCYVAAANAACELEKFLHAWKSCGTRDACARETHYMPLIMSNGSFMQLSGSFKEQHQQCGCEQDPWHVATDIISRKRILKIWAPPQTQAVKPLLHAALNRHGIHLLQPVHKVLRLL